MNQTNIFISVQDKENVLTIHVKKNKYYPCSVWEPAKYQIITQTIYQQVDFHPSGFVILNLKLITSFRVHCFCCVFAFRDDSGYTVTMLLPEDLGPVREIIIFQFRPYNCLSDDIYGRWKNKLNNIITGRIVQ